MNKQEFLTELGSRLSGLNEKERQSRLNFYAEMIDDMVDEGKTEERAVEEIGGADKVVRDIADDTPLTRILKGKIKPEKKIGGGKTALIVLGFPVWFPLLTVAVVLMLVAVILTWAFVLVAYAAEASAAVSALGSAVMFLFYLFGGKTVLLFLGAAISATGLSFLLWFVCKKLTALTVKADRAILLGIKTILIGRRKA